MKRRWKRYFYDWHDTSINVPYHIPFYVKWNFHVYRDYIKHNCFSFLVNLKNEINFLDILFSYICLKVIGIFHWIHIWFGKYIWYPSYRIIHLLNESNFQILSGIHSEIAATVKKVIEFLLFLVQIEEISISKKQVKFCSQFNFLRDYE